MLNTQLRSMRWIRVFGLALATLSCNRSHPNAGPAADESAAQIEVAAPHLFRDATHGSGVDFTYRNGQEAGHYAILESLGGGVALIDFDGDGLLDIFFTGGGYYD